MDLEERMRAAVVRAYRAAGVDLHEKHIASLAWVYATWAGSADDSVVERVEKALIHSLCALKH